MRLSANETGLDTFSSVPESILVNNSSTATFECRFCLLKRPVGLPSVSSHLAIAITNLNHYVYLTLGNSRSIRATVKAGDTLVTDGFDATLAQWTTVKGCCFTVGSSALSNTATPGAESILITSSSVTTDDGLLSSTVSYTGPVSTGAPCLVFRYQDVSNFSYVSPGASNLAVVERISGTDYTRASVSLSMSSGTAYRFEVSFRGSAVTVKRDGAVVLGSSALTRLSAGKAGVRVSRSYSGSSSWRDVTVLKTGVDQIASYDDFYPYGQVIEGRSFNAGLSDARYKYTEKERDVETGYDYFGARYYDSRMGRWMSCDPLSFLSLEASPYRYARNSPLCFVDTWGLADTSKVNPRPIPNPRPSRDFPLVIPFPPLKLSPIIINPLPPAGLPAAASVQADATAARTQQPYLGATDPIRGIGEVLGTVSSASGGVGLGLIIGGILLKSPSMFFLGADLLEISMYSQYGSALSYFGSYKMYGDEESGQRARIQGVSIILGGAAKFGANSIIKETGILGPVYYNNLNGRWIPNSVGCGAQAMPDALSMIIEYNLTEHSARGR